MRYDIITTNSVECLNALFREVRGLPITTLIEMTRRKVSEWFFKRCKVSLTLTTTLIGKMKTVLAENRHKCHWHAVHPHWDHFYQDLDREVRFGKSRVPAFTGIWTGSSESIIVDMVGARVPISV
ncbi:hypothetical protein Cni_G20668 [Canna indica]|uniref:Uncharacterized protein n=1 Tax=Canna indica TaxID=4628 RepID=A0AAQ3KNK0_9LILI|nr:hypothetical protein Cni_G20668 [Canna indica]